jgi:hypothetical protein
MGDNKDYEQLQSLAAPSCLSSIDGSCLSVIAVLLEQHLLSSTLRRSSISLPPISSVFWWEIFFYGIEDLSADRREDDPKQYNGTGISRPTYPTQLKVIITRMSQDTKPVNLSCSLHSTYRPYPELITRTPRIIIFLVAGLSRRIGT